MQWCVFNCTPLSGGVSLVGDRGGPVEGGADPLASQAGPQAGLGEEERGEGCDGQGGLRERGPLQVQSRFRSAAERVLPGVPRHPAVSGVQH